MDIKIISGTDRPNSNSLKFSNFIQAKFMEFTNQNVDVISLEDFPLADVQGGIYGSEPQSVIEFRQPIVDADGLLFVIPEYNGSFPGILKMLIDYLPFPESFVNMPIAYIGIAAGAFGAMRPVEQFQMVTAYRNAVSFPERLFIPRFSKEFDSEAGLTDHFKQELLKSMVVNFVEFVGKNREFSLA